jgi:hypothetical protein
VENIVTVSDARVSARDAADAPVRQQSGAEYPVGEFLKGVGVVVATCLVLALSAHILVAIVGVY